MVSGAGNNHSRGRRAKAQQAQVRNQSEAQRCGSGEAVHRLMRESGPGDWDLQGHRPTAAWNTSSTAMLSHSTCITGCTVTGRPPYRGGSSLGGEDISRTRVHSSGPYRGMPTKKLPLHQ